MQFHLCTHSPFRGWVRHTLGFWPFVYALLGRTMGHQDISHNSSPPWGSFNQQVPFSSLGVLWSMLPRFSKVFHRALQLYITGHGGSGGPGSSGWLCLHPTHCKVYLSPSLMIYVVCIPWLWTTGSFIFCPTCLGDPIPKFTLGSSHTDWPQQEEAGTQSSISEMGCTHRSRREQDAPFSVERSDY